MPVLAVDLAESSRSIPRPEFRPEGSQPVHPTESLIVRELRHQTKNALQRILGLIEDAPELKGSARTRSLSEELQRRILLAARVSDALFGLTCYPGTLENRMRSMAEAVVELLGRRGANVHLTVDVDGRPLEDLHQSLLRVAHEFIGNAVKHGLGDRRSGKIMVRLKARSDQVLLTVADDGGCFDRRAFRVGEGLTLAREIAGEHRGTLDLRRVHDHTVAILNIPIPQRAHHLSILR